jgi:hypothetical protein
MKDNGVSLKTNTASFQQLGSAMMMTGMAVGLLGGLFESLGWEEGAEAAQLLSGILTGLGMVFTIVSMAATAFKVSMIELVVPILIVVGALGVLIYLLSGLFGKSPLEKEVENAATAAEVAANAAKEAK